MRGERAIIIRAILSGQRRRIMWAGRRATVIVVQDSTTGARLAGGTRTITPLITTSYGGNVDR